MSIWGKLVGGAAGFAIGGPIGLLLGVAAGHFVDRMARRDATSGRKLSGDVRSKQAAFAVALIVLCAKMAKADGQVTREEINAFKRIFRVPESEMVEVGRIFNEARKEGAKGIIKKAKEDQPPLRGENRQEVESGTLADLSEDKLANIYSDGNNPQSQAAGKILRDRGYLE